MFYELQTVINQKRIYIENQLKNMLDSYKKTRMAQIDIVEYNMYLDCYKELNEIIAKYESKVNEHRGR